MQTPTSNEPSLVAELRQLYGEAWSVATSNAYERAAGMAERHESRWQADRAALVGRAETAEKRLGELLAVIFGDGGHRQSEIGDDAEAVRQAREVWAAGRLRLEAVRQLAVWLKGSGDNETPCDDYLLGARAVQRTVAEQIMAVIEKGASECSL